MTPEEKDLLLKDLCARLPYMTKVRRYRYTTPIDSIQSVELLGLGWLEELYGEEAEFKPYLFPLSSMTEEQKKEISKRYKLHTYYGLCIEITNHSEGYWDDDNSCNLQDYLWLVDWFNKNHFDYRGLIEKGLAIDATGLNIY